MPKEPRCRIPLLKPFTTMESLVVALLVRGEGYRAIGLRLHISKQAVGFHSRNASRKIPGDLQPFVRIQFWGRGATLDQLTGEGWMPGPPDQEGL
jgi:hypothetical protein